MRVPMIADIAISINDEYQGDVHTLMNPFEMVIQPVIGVQWSM